MGLLQKKGDFNSYLVRGEYDIVTVSLESSHFLFKAFIDSKIEELRLEDTTTFAVDEFLKYHGCLVTPIRGGEDPSFLPPETFHYLFNLSKDWDSVPETFRTKLLDMNLLMVNASGLPYETEVLPENQERGMERRTIVRLGFYDVHSSAVSRSLQDFMNAEIVNSPLVRSCYSLKLSAPYFYLLELSGSSGDIDDFLLRLHYIWESGFPSLKIFARCDDVIQRLSEGYSNILLTLQARPDLVARAEERLIAPLLYGEHEAQTALIDFIERSEALIRSISSESTQKRCLEMLSEIQLAFQLNSHSLLQEAVNVIARCLLDLMVAKLAVLYHCDATVDAVIAELKRRGLFREHTATFGNLYPIFVKADQSRAAGRDPDTKEGQVFERFNTFRNNLVFSKGSDTSTQLTNEKRRQAEALFLELLHEVPRYFIVEAGRTGSD